MKTTQIFVICTLNAGGRYVHTATPDRGRADALAARLDRSYTADGWNVEEIQHPRPDEWNGEGPGVPAVVEVFRLRNAAGVWCNIELYRVEDINEN